MRIISAALLSGTLLGVVHGTAGAQDASAAPGTGAAPSASSTAAQTNIGPAEAWSAKPVGKYDLVVKVPDRDMPSDLTITESDGKVTALFWPVGDNDGHVMTVTVKGTDLILNAETPRGPVVFDIERRGAKLTGTWQMGIEHGTLEGITKS